MVYGDAHMAATGGTSNARWRARAGAGLVRTGGVAMSRPDIDAHAEGDDAVMPLRWSLVTVPSVAGAVLGLGGLFGPRPMVFVATGLMVMALAAVIDIATAQLPDPLVIGVIVAAVFGWAMTDVDARQVVAGALLMGLPVLVVHLISPIAMGFGDVKAALALGALIGLIEATAALFALALATAVMALIGLGFGLRSVPLGPGLVIGGAAAWCWTRWVGTGEW